VLELGGQGRRLREWKEGSVDAVQLWLCVFVVVYEREPGMRGRGERGQTHKDRLETRQTYF